MLHPEQNSNQDAQNFVFFSFKRQEPRSSDGKWARLGSQAKVLGTQHLGWVAGGTGCQGNESSSPSIMGKQLGATKKGGQVAKNPMGLVVPKL